MTNIKRMPYVAKWLQMGQDDVLDKFMGIPSAYTDGEGQERFVFVPGTRDDRVLLVAHADSVFPNVQLKLGYHKNILYSKARNEKFSYNNRHSVTIEKTGIGIRADDRAGCAILWLLRNLGHSLLITSGEEVGCVATKRILEDDYWNNHLNTTHNFAVQFDRRNKTDLVFYDVATKKFVEYVRKETGFHVKESHGNTDIRELCKKICGVNISTGYYNEHTSEEKLCVDEWQNTLLIAKEWLSKKELGKFELDICDRFFYYSSSYNSHNTYNYSNNSNPHKDKYYNDDYDGHNYWPGMGRNVTKKFQITEEGVVPFQPKTEIKKTDNSPSIKDKFVWCKYCFHSMTVGFWFKNNFRCDKCKKEI